MRNQKIFLITIFSLVIIFYFSNILLRPSVPMGESDDYMLPTISLEQHLTDEIKDSDLEIALSQYPEHSWYWKEWQAGNFAIMIDGKRYTYYFPTYSILCLPFIWLLRLFKLSQSYGFALANVVYYLFGMFLVFKLPISKFLRIIAILILSFSPIIFYFRWPSAESVIAALLIYTLGFLFLKHYKLSMLSCALASTINITITPFSIFIYLYIYINNYHSEYTIKQIYKNVLKDRRLFLSLLSINLISLLPIILNLYRVKRFAIMQSAGTFFDLGGRLLAYLTDLNMGIMPYFPFLFLIIPLTLFFSKYNIRYLLFLIFSSIILFGFSLMIHIACGMSGIARYNSWYVILLIVATIYNINFISNKAVKYIQYFLLCLSFFWVFSVTFYYGNIDFQDPKLWDRNFQPLASYFLENYPSLYSPFPIIFISKTLKVDGADYGYEGYNKSNPIIYYDKNKKIKKILLTPIFANIIKNSLTTPDNLNKNDIFKQIIMSNKQDYVNIKQGASICNYFDFGKYGNDNDKLTKGFSNIEKYGVWTDGNLSSMSFPLQKTDVKNFSLIIEPFLCDGNDKRKVTIKIGDNSKTFDISLKGIQELTMPVPDVGKNTDVSIFIHNPKAPSDCNKSSDTRRLGVFLRAAAFY